jgi:lipopolysaccharide transport system ATP-binding protein
MSSIAIRAEGLSKQYRLGAKHERYRSLRDVIARSAMAPFRRLRQVLQGHSSVEWDRTVWALKDLTFEIPHGEVIGIIGHNGAGKSTLLKTLARITEPTEGVVDIFGRVGSLLEVGTGFHPELTGRENVYLSGALLGMRKREIDRKFDEIVAFAEIDAFLDTMVKHYSSGMYMRLAFSVAAHLEPEILIVDEVLAVGDQEFQKKCLGKMQDVGQLGRTVLFVSHNMTAVTRLCQRAMLLEHGRLVAVGPTTSIISDYLFKGHGTSAERRWTDERLAPGDETIRLLSVRAHDENDEVQRSFDIRHPIGIEITYQVYKAGMRFTPCFALLNETGTILFFSQEVPLWQDAERPVGRHTTTGWIPGNLLAEGTFQVDIVFWGFAMPPTGRITPG